VTEPPGTDLVATEQVGRVLVIAMQRPHKRNAVDRALADALSGALDRLDDDPDLWAGVLTGTPDMFSAGSDLTSGGDYVTERGGEYGIIRRARRRPLIAAVEGMALGGGMEIVLACDLVVAATTASFGMPEVTRGLVPTCGGLFRSLLAMPRNLAHELVLTGRPIDAGRAHGAGLVNRLSEPGRSVEVALELAEEITSNGPTAVALALQAMQELDAATAALGWPATDRATTAVSTSEDVREGVAAFLEKRAPVWSGR